MRSYVIQHAVTLGTVLLVAGCVTDRTTAEKAAVQAKPLVKASTTTVPPVTRMTIGKWKASGQGSFHIYRSSKRTFLRRQSANGTTETIRLKPFQHKLGQGFRPARPGPHYWIIDRDGDLQTWSNQGYTGLARRS